MKNRDGWVLALTVVGVLAFILSPLTPPLWMALILIGIVASGYLAMKYYVLPDDNEKGKK